MEPLLASICVNNNLNIKIIGGHTIREPSGLALSSRNNLLCDSEICSNRDYKDIYNRIDINSDECLPGVTEPYILSKEAELILDTGTNTLKDCEDILFRAVLDFLGKINTKSIEI